MLRLTLLGGFSLERDGQLLTGRASQNKRLVVLAVLAVAPGQRVSRDKLSALLWPEHDAEHARHQLTSAVYELRHALGGDLIWSVGDDLQLNLELVTADLLEFLAACRDQAWERAVALYVGPFLDGFHISGSAEFEGWLQLERDRFAAAHATALRSLALAAEQAGDLAAAVEWWRRLVAQEPYDSDAALQLVQEAVRKGDHAAAVRYARRHVERLQRELGVEPPPAFTPYLQPHSAEGPERATSTVTAPHPVERRGGMPITGTPTIRRRRYRERRILLIGTLGFVLLATLIAAASLIVTRGSELAPRRLAVAPFENRTGDPALGRLGELTADWITQALAAAELVEVADGVAALRRVAGSDSLTAGLDAVRLLARSTGAGLVVTGRYYRKADSLQVLAQVVDARSEQVVRAADPVSASLRAPDLAAERVGRQLLGMLVVLLDPRLADYPPQKPPPTYEAYMEFVAGGRHNRVDEWGEAQSHFARAFQLDSTFYPALLIRYGAATIQRAGTTPQQMDSLETLIERLEPKLSTRQWVTFERNRAYRRGDKRAGYATAQRMFQLQSGSAGAAWTLAIEAGRVHRYREALTLLRRIGPDGGLSQYWPFRSGAEHALGDFPAQLSSAAALERAQPGMIVPDGIRLTAHAALGHAAEVRRLAFTLTARLAVDSMARLDLGNIESLGFPRAAPMPLLMAARELLAHGHAEAAHTMAEAALRWCADQPAAERDSVGFRFVHASLYGMLGRWRDAERVLEGGAPDEKLLQWYRAITAAKLGQRDRALEIAATLGESREGWGWWRPGASAAVANFYHATVAAALGDRDEAYRRLRILVAAGGDFGEWWLHTEPTLVPYFRNDPEFKRLLEPEG